MIGAGDLPKETPGGKTLFRRMSFMAKDISLRNVA